MSSEKAELLEFAVSVARDAGRLLVDYQLERDDLDTQVKSTPTDLVSAADRDSEALVRERIVEMHPDDVIVGEENERRPGTSGRTWVVDPLDGTTNFLFGLPSWAVSIGCEDDEGPLVGCVLDPNRNELFTATRGGGARLNEREIAVSTRGELSEALVATGFNYDSMVRELQARHLTGLIGEVRDIRRGGAASLDLAWVAAGRLDGFYEAGLGWWDWAAGSLLVREAGGSFAVATGPRGMKQVIASNAALGSKLERLVTRSR